MVTGNLLHMSFSWKRGRSCLHGAYEPTVVRSQTTILFPRNGGKGVNLNGRHREQPMRNNSGKKKRESVVLMRDKK